MADHTETLPSATIDNWRQYPHSAWGFQHVDQIVPTRTIVNGKPAPAFARGESLDFD